jgi:hypothetical protein
VISEGRILFLPSFFGLAAAVVVAAAATSAVVIIAEKKDNDDNNYQPCVIAEEVHVSASFRRVHIYTSYNLIL